MADYARAELHLLYGTVSDFSDRLLDRYWSKSYTTPTKAFPLYGLSAAITTGTTVDFGGLNLTTVTSMAVKNLDSSNFVEVQWTDQSTANKVKLTAGEFMRVPLATISADLVLVADTEPCLCDIILFGT